MGDHWRQIRPWGWWVHHGWKIMKNEGFSWENHWTSMGKSMGNPRGLAMEV